MGFEFGMPRPLWRPASLTGCARAGRMQGMRTARLIARGWLAGLALGVADLPRQMSAQTPAQPTVTYFRLSGTVTDPEGAPVPDADVVLVQDSTPARLIRSDSEGRFVVTDL